jgi:hypothetical protein
MNIGDRVVMDPQPPADAVIEFGMIFDRVFFVSRPGGEGLPDVIRSPEELTPFVRAVLHECVWYWEVTDEAGLWGES